MQPSQLSCSDSAFTLLEADDLFYRAIEPASKEYFEGMLASGLLQELYQRGLIPLTQRSQRDLPGFDLVLEQERIKPLILPYEWSPEMLRKAAICTLRVNQCANEFGYELKDAHPYNIVFNGSRPLFVDIGSFISISQRGCWGAYTEFKDSFESVLRLAGGGQTMLFKHAHQLSGAGYPAHELFALRHPWIARLLGARLLQLCAYAWGIYRIGPTIAETAIDERFTTPWQRECARFLLQTTWLPGRAFSHAKALRKIKRINLRHATSWGNYHDRSGLSAAPENLELSERFKWVKDQAVALNPASILEVAGNQGVLARVIAAALPESVKIVCSDYDTQAIDSLTLSLGQSSSIFPACFDLMRDTRERLTLERAQRLRSELVIALAVTHHLVLSQSLEIGAICRTLASMTYRYLIVEFMPLGLWVPGDTPRQPDWYNEEWFVTALQKHFTIQTRKQLEENRIAFICQKQEYTA